MSTVAIRSEEPSRSGWIGPVLGWEVLRLGRRGATIWLRVLMGLLLFAALWAVYLSQFPAEVYTQNNAQIATGLSNFTQKFGYVYLMAQLGVICLLTPLYVVGAMSEERDRKTLEFLLATDLSNWEIIIGKVGSRMVQLLGLLVAGIPIIALMQVWGGVEPILLLVGYGIALLTLFAVSGICVACASIPGTLRGTALRSFIALGLIYGLLYDLSPFAALHETFRRSGALLAGDVNFMLGAWQFFKWQFFLGSVGILIAVFCLRRCAFAQSGRKSRMTRTRSTTVEEPRRLPQAAVTGGWGAESELTEGLPRTREKRHWADPPPIKGSPLLWKEVHFSGQMNKYAKLLALLPPWMWMMIGMVLSVMMFTADESPTMRYSSNLFTRVVSMAFLFFVCLTVGLSAAGSISRERQNLTMIDLLMIPRSRSEFLMAKWLAALRKGIPIACGLIAILTGALVVGWSLAGGVTLLGFVLMLIAVPVYACFSASLGLFLSVRCSTVLRASCWWLLVVLLTLGGTFLLIESQTARDDPIRRTFGMYPDRDTRPYPVWDRVINPIYTWNQFGFATIEDRDEYYNYLNRERRWGHLSHAFDLFPALLGLALYATLAWALWWLALERFEREGQ